MHIFSLASFFSSNSNQLIDFVFGRYLHNRHRSCLFSIIVQHCARSRIHRVDRARSKRTEARCCRCWIYATSGDAPTNRWKRGFILIGCKAHSPPLDTRCSTYRGLVPLLRSPRLSEIDPNQTLCPTAPSSPSFSSLNCRVYAVLAL